MGNRRSIRQSSTTSKLLRLLLIALFSIFWIFFLLATVGSFWETMSLACQPQPQEIICQIEGEPHRRTTVPKAQLSDIQVIRKPGKKYIDRIVLRTLDRQEIPLNGGIGGEITNQLNGQVDRIQAFIADPQAQTLTVKTHRNIPLGLLPLFLLIGFMLWQAGRQAQSIWRRY